MEFESELIPDTMVEHADRLLKEMIDGKDRKSKTKSVEPTTINRVNSLFVE